MTLNVEACVRKAIEGFEGVRRDQYLNCCQSIIMGLGDLTPTRKELLVKVGTGFGGGFAGMGRICGALTGGIMLLGDKYGVYGSEPYEVFKEKKGGCKDLVREFYSWFEAENGALNCQEITGIDSSTEEGMVWYTDLKQSHKVPCYRVIENSVRKLYEILTSQ